MNDTPTPRTDERKASFALDTIRQLETELTAVTEQRDRLAEALKLIATWHSYDELHDEVIECADFAFGYDEAIKISREALQSLREDQNEL